MIKLTGMLLIFGCGVLIGFNRASVLSERAGELELITEYLRQFRMRLQLQKSQPGDIAAAIGRQSRFSKLRFASLLTESCRVTPDFSIAVRNAVEGCGRALGAAADILISLGDTVGIKALEAQLADMDAVIMLMDRETQRAQQDSGKYGNLYRRLGTLGGLLAAVIFI